MCKGRGRATGAQYCSNFAGALQSWAGAADCTERGAPSSREDPAARPRSRLAQGPSVGPAPAASALTLASKQMPCWKASSLCRGIRRSCPSSTRLYLVLLGMVPAGGCGTSQGRLGAGPARHRRSWAAVLPREGRAGAGGRREAGGRAGGRDREEKAKGGGGGGGEIVCHGDAGSARATPPPAAVAPPRAEAPPTSVRATPRRVSRAGAPPCGPTRDSLRPGAQSQGPRPGPAFVSVRFQAPARPAPEGSRAWVFGCGVPCWVL